MNWETLYCPNRQCQYFGKPFFQGKLIKYGSSHGKKQALCRECHQKVSLTYATAYFDMEADQTIFETAIRALAEGNSIRSPARIVQVDKDTICNWLNRAADQCRKIVLYHWHNLHVSECQLDEVWSFVHTKEQHLASAKLFCHTYGDAWIWVAFAPVQRLVIAFVVGKRTKENAQLLLNRVRFVSDKQIPFFTSDQWSAYEEALLKVYGQVYQPARRGNRGRYPAPQLRPLPGLLYAQVVKHRSRGRIVEVTRKVIFGSEQEVDAQLAKSQVSQMINTSFVEPENLNLRQYNRRLTRKTIGFSKELSWLEKQFWLFQGYYHFCLPHQSLKRLPQLEITRGCGSPRKWKSVTPAMAAGITDHVWTTTELLSFRVPVEFLDNLDTINHLFPDFNDVHHLN